MGYFNIFYKITRIIDMLTRKRNRKFIVAILVIIGIIFLLHNKGYCAQADSDYTTDTTYYILEQYQSFVNQLCKIYNDSYNKPSTNETTRNFNDLFTKLGQGWFMYIYNHSETNAVIYMYRHDYSKTLIDTSLVYNDYLRIPSTCYNITIPSGSMRYVVNNTTGIITTGTISSDYNVAVPFILYKRTPIEVVNLMERSGIGYNASSESLIDIKSQMNQIKNKIDTTNDNLEAISEDITSTDYDENAVEVDTSAVDSMSDTEVNGLFSTIVSNFNNSLNSWNGTTSIIFYIPFTNGRYISIPDNIVSSKLPTQFLDLVHAFWYFVFGLYLFRFINNLIKKIRSGDILNGYSNDNEVITSNML